METKSFFTFLYVKQAVTNNMLSKRNNYDMIEQTLKGRSIMKVTGIIAEYNPFHMGHLHQINYIKKELDSDYIIIAMSGDFVQRGTPALFPKHLRAEMALRCGADLVLELPVQFSAASAEFFAEGGVSLLDGLGVIDRLCFGSEEGSTKGMLLAADILNQEPKEYQTFLQKYLKKGMSFPAARSLALKDHLSLLSKETPQLLPEGLLSSPNNILGIEYCRALLKRSSPIKPVTLKRKGGAYHDTAMQQDQAPSASAIRTYLKEQLSFYNNELSPLPLLESAVPAAALKLFMKAVSENEFLTEDDMDLVLHYVLLKSSYHDLLACTDVSPELARRILNQRNHYRSFSRFAELLKTKELTHTRIQRALLHILLEITENPRELPYGRVLGFRKEASPLLKSIKSNSSIPLLTKMADAENLLSPEGQAILNKNTEASNIYESLLCHKTKKPFCHEYQKPPVILP